MANQKCIPQLRHENGSSFENEVVNATKVEEKTLSNICYDCLERIFDFLDFESLLNVAGTCKRLQIAAAAKFAYDHNSKSIKLYVSHPNIIRTGDSGEIKSIGLNLSFPFLRCFGAKLSSLQVFYGDADPDARSDHLDRYINQYCADTLTEILLLSKQNFRMENFPKPFKNVTKVIIVGMPTGNMVPNNFNLFANWFPNVHRLCLSSILIDDTAAFYPHLKQLRVFASYVNNTKFFATEKMLQANRQLESFEILSYHKEITLDKLLNMISGNPLILKLEVIGSKEVNVNAAELNRFIAEHPLIEELYLDKYRLTADDAIMFIRQLKSLKKFKFRVKEQSECDRLLKVLDDKWKKVIRNGSDCTRMELSC